MAIKTIGIVGAGTMGQGIAQVCASTGHEVMLQDIADGLVTKGIARVDKNLERMVTREKISSAEKEDAIARIKGVSDLEQLSAADLIIEAATENMDIKLQIFPRLNAICKTETILASNTSSLSLTKIAAASGRAGQVVGMHFFNPVPVMKLVEIIRALQTSEETYQAIHDLTFKLGKMPVSVKDSPGFVVNRMLVPMINEAVFALYEGLASAEEIDAAMKAGANHPIGPLALADMIGVDVCLYVMEILLEEFGDSKYRPCPLLKQMVNAGYLGRKSGRGFFVYSS